MRSLYLAPALLFASTAQAHMCFWHKAMWCLEGASGSNNNNSNDCMDPLYQLPKYGGWWFHAFNKCDQFPPAAGEFLELPAGGVAKGEHANNRGFTSLAFNGKYSGEWTNGVTAPVYPANGDCISSPLLHAHNENDATATALAIAYVSELSEVTMENLAVFSVVYHTPWKREVEFPVPKDMPACPPDGCICAWLWAPNHCGQPNMYMEGLRCKVTGATSTAPVAKAKPPTWCENNSSACTKGAKQMLVFNQAEGNNIDISGYQANGDEKSPNYNMKCGFKNGAQNDIFETTSSSPATTSKKTTTTSSVSLYVIAQGTPTSKVTTSTHKASTSTSTHTAHASASTSAVRNNIVNTTTTHQAKTTAPTSAAHSTSSNPASSAKAGHCSSKSKRNIAKQHLDRHKKRHSAGSVAL